MEQACPESLPIRRIAITLTLALASCQSYARRPLEPERHRAAWHARTLEDQSLASFLERLAAEGDPAAADFDPSDGLTLDEGRLVALVFQPALRLARLSLERADASLGAAGRWADPELGFSALKITESVPSPWILGPELTFTIPLSGRPGAERKLGRAERRAAEKRVAEKEWGVWHAVGRGWFEWSSAELRLAESERFLEAVESLAATTAKLAQSGELAPGEASLFAVEAARERNRLVRLRADVAVREQELRALLGLAPEAPVRFVRLDEARGSNVALAATQEDLAQRNPTLARLRKEYAVAEARLRREVRKQFPDLTLGPAYESDEGQSRIGLVGGIPLPILNANSRAIAEARVDREIARAAFETEYEALAGKHALLELRVAALDEQIADVENVLAPLVDAQLADSVRLLELGEGTGLVLFESLTRAHAIKLDFIGTRLARSIARAELEHLIGPPRSASATETIDLTGETL